MKKLILVLVVFAVVTGSVFADFDIMSFPPSVQAGNIMIDAGIGLRVYSGLDMAFPPLFLQGEYALPVGVPISVGAGLTFGQWKWSSRGLFGNLGYKVTYVTPHLRANWHWGFDIPWLDFYTGTSLGWSIASVTWDGTAGSGAAGSEFFFAFQAGAHFYFSEHIGAVAETGYPYWLKAGIAIKF